MTNGLRDERQEVSPEIAWERFEAMAPAQSMIEAWSAGAQAMALLQAVDEAGWLGLLAEGCDLTTLESHSGLTAPRLETVLDALAGYGVVERDADLVRLTPSFALLSGGDATCPLPDVLAYQALLPRLVREALTAPGGTLAGEDALTEAKAVSGRVTPLTQAMFRRLTEDLPEYKVLGDGGRLLDVGCGVAWGMLNLALLYPRGRQVGIELVPEVAAEARRRAEDLGVRDRVEVRCQDARTFEEKNSFDLAFWAQPFFPAPARAETLGMIFRALKPGGVLLMQELFARPEEGDEDATRAFALDRLRYQSRGVEFAPSAEHLSDEAVAAGFEQSRLAETPVGRVVVMRRPVSP